MKLSLISRSYCSLCSHMLEAVKLWQAKFQFEIEVIDVDEDEKLLAQYDEKVPVLLNHLGEEICHWHLDEMALENYLSEFGRQAV